MNFSRKAFRGKDCQATSKLLYELASYYLRSGLLMLPSLVFVLHNIVAFAAIISIVVFIHELGHYLVARWSGVKIEVFSIGFGKELWGRFDKHGTRWKICLLPLGGYVKMYGDVNAASQADTETIAKMSQEEQRSTFYGKPLAIKAAIVAAGPIANFILAIFVLIALFFWYGKSEATTVIGKVMPDSPAAAAGLKEGDMILAIDGTSVSTFAEVQRIVYLHPEETLRFSIRRDEKTLELPITPAKVEIKDAFGHVSKVGRIGVHSGFAAYRKLPFMAAVKEGVKETYNMTASTLTALKQMIVGKRGTEDLGGPIRIAQYAGEAASMGIAQVLWFIAVLSANLGLMNLFPIPVLDGGHLMYYAIEAVRGKPLAERFQRYGFQIGIGFILLLMVLTTFNDIKHLMER